MINLKQEKDGRVWDKKKNFENILEFKCFCSLKRMLLNLFPKIAQMLVKNEKNRDCKCPLKAYFLGGKLNNMI